MFKAEQEGLSILLIQYEPTVVRTLENYNTLGEGIPRGSSQLEGKISTTSL
jgi:hypothetical protein